MHTSRVQCLPYLGFVKVGHKISQVSNTGKKTSRYSPFYFKLNVSLLFLHNSYGTSEFPNSGNLVGADCMGNLRWANTEPSMHFRKTNTDPSVHFRKANTDPSVHFRKANTEFLLPVLLPTPNFTSKFTPSFIPNITINLLHHDECNTISQVTVN